jgi:hypothetical protein
VIQLRHPSPAFCNARPLARSAVKLAFVSSSANVQKQIYDGIVIRQRKAIVHYLCTSSTSAINRVGNESGGRFESITIESLKADEI